MEEDKTCAICKESLGQSIDSHITLSGGLYYKGHPIIPDEDTDTYICINCFIEILEKIRRQAVENITKKMSLEQQRLDKLMLSMVREKSVNLDIPDFCKK